MLVVHQLILPRIAEHGSIRIDTRIYERRDRRQLLRYRETRLIRAMFCRESSIRTVAILPVGTEISTNYGQFPRELVVKSRHGIFGRSEL